MGKTSLLEDSDCAGWLEHLLDGVSDDDGLPLEDARHPIRRVSLPPLLFRLGPINRVASRELRFAAVTSIIVGPLKILHRVLREVLALFFILIKQDFSD